MVARFGQNFMQAIKRYSKYRTIFIIIDIFTVFMEFTVELNKKIIYNSKR